WAGVRWWTVTPFVAGDEEQPGEPDLTGDGGGHPAFRLDATPAEAYRGDTSRVIADVSRWLADRWRVVLVTEGHGPAQRVAELLRGEGLGARLEDLSAPGEPPEAGVAHVATGMIAHGFAWPSVRLAVLSEADLAGQRVGAGHERMPSRRRGGIDPLQLVPGDYIVHEQHGVRRYLEMTSRTVAGATPHDPGLQYPPGQPGP